LPLLAHGLLQHNSTMRWKAEKGFCRLQDNLDRRAPGARRATDGTWDTTAGENPWGKQKVGGSRRAAPKRCRNACRTFNPKLKKRGSPNCSGDLGEGPTLYKVFARKKLVVQVLEESGDASRKMVRGRLWFYTEAHLTGRCRIRGGVVQSAALRARCN